MHQLLKTIRKRTLTQAKLSKQLGISVDRITGIEQGTGKLSLNELHDYLTAIDATALILPNTILNASKTG